MSVDLTKLNNLENMTGEEFHDSIKSHKLFQNVKIRKRELLEEALREPSGGVCGIYDNTFKFTAIQGDFTATITRKGKAISVHVKEVDGIEIKNDLLNIGE